jgi:phosphatidate cytidylyltransferase
MALDGFRLRLVTSLFFAVVMFAGIFSGGYFYALLFGVILIICLWEFLQAEIVGNLPSDRLVRLFSMALALLPYLTATAYRFNWMNTVQLEVIGLVFPALLFFTFLLVLFGNRPTPFKDVGNTFIGVLYLGLPFTLLNLAVLTPEGTYRMDIVLGLLFLTWTNDSGAYLVGSKIGKTPFFPRISPKKTWEGIIGAGILTLGISVVLYYMFPGLSLIHWLVLGILVFIFGSLGDLVESMFKRGRQIKDSGSLLPGHGGFLDRFDGFIFHLPFTATYLMLFS